MTTTSISTTEIRELISSSKFVKFVNINGGNKFSPSINDAYNYVKIDHEDGRSYIRVRSNKGDFTVAVKKMVN